MACYARQGGNDVRRIMIFNGAQENEKQVQRFVRRIRLTALHAKTLHISFAQLARLNAIIHLALTMCDFSVLHNSTAQSRC